MRRILVTGGAGFVGRRFVKSFLEAGDEVIVVDSVASLTGGIDPQDGWPMYEPRDYKNFHFVRGDCRDYFKEHPNDHFDYTFHLAAMVGGRLIIENNPLVVADDLSIDSSYWQWARTSMPGKTVTFSSSAAYPIKFQTEHSHVMLTEDMIDFQADIGIPDLSYGWAKLTCEFLGRLAYERHGLRSVAYRPFSGYAEDQDDTYPFPSICKRAIENMGRNELTVWGSGTQMRDFIHIDDCVRGVLTTMDSIDDGSALNLSTGSLTSFLEFAKIAAKACGYSPVVRGLTDHPSGVFARGGDTTKQKAFGFTAKTKFSDGVSAAIKYYMRNN